MLVVSLGMLVVAAGAALVVGWLLPPVREGRAEILIDAPPERVLAVIADVEAQPLWRDGIVRVDRTDEGWNEVNARGETIRFDMVTLGLDRIELRFASDAGYEGRWTAVLTTEGEGTIISVVERAEIRSPIGRIIARLVFDPDEFASSYLSQLKTRSEGT